MPKFYPPEHKKEKFHCVHCGVFSAQIWCECFYRCSNDSAYPREHEPIEFCVCVHCNKWSYWYRGRMVVPSQAPVPPAHIDMPNECRVDYDEARDIVARSPRAASALVRLSLQRLLTVLGAKGQNINEDIRELVEKGLPIEVQRALDICRVVGNHSVHPGEIDVNDTPEIAHSLFDMMNFIVEDRISRPKNIASLYEKLPEGARNAIKERDGK